MKDFVVMQSLEDLRRSGNVLPLEQILILDSMENKPRILDKAPKKLSFQKSTSSVKYGCREEFVTAYNYLSSNYNFEQYTIEFDNHVKFCDKEIFVTLHSLYMISNCNIQDKSIACADLFKWILTRPCDVYTTGKLKEELPKYTPINYWAGELMNGIKSCVYNVPSYVLLWETLCDFHGYYKEAIELGKGVIEQKCHSDDDVEQFLKPLRVEARNDEEFKSKLVKKGTNKYLTPMLYYLKDSHPEVLEATGGLA